MSYKISKNDVKNQTTEIQYHLQEKGSITSWEAIKEYGITRLSAVIFTLRGKGLVIKSEPIKTKNRFGRTILTARYVLKGSNTTQTNIFQSMYKWATGKEQ